MYLTLIADDHPIYRIGLLHILDRERKYQCIEACDGKEAIKKIVEYQPDIAILDIKMPDTGGLDVLGKTIQQSPKTRYVILTMYNDEKLIERAFDLGASAYLLKENAESELIQCLVSICNNQRYLSQAIFEDSHISPNSTKHDSPSLTPAEKHIAKLVSEFKTSREIANILNISIRTVQNHRSHMVNKLNLKGNNALLNFALKHFSQ